MESHRFLLKANTTMVWRRKLKFESKF